VNALLAAARALRAAASKGKALPKQSPELVRLLIIID